MKQITLRLICFILLITQLPVFNLAQRTPQPRKQPDYAKLTLRPIERELKAGEVHTYSLQLETGQSAEIMVDQDNLDVIVSVFTSSGEKLAEVNKLNAAQGGTETVPIVTGKVTAYRVEVSSPDKTAAGSYIIRLTNVRATPLLDPSSVTTSDSQVPKTFDLSLPNSGDRTTNLALRLVAAKTEEEGDALLAAYSAMITERLGEMVSGEAWRLMNAETPRPRVVLVFKVLVKIVEQLDNNFMLANAYGGLSRAYSETGQFDLGLDYARKSISLSEQLKNVPILLGFGYLNLGRAYRGKLENDRALEYLFKSIALFEKDGASTQLGKQNLSAAYWFTARAYVQKGDDRTAVEYYQKSFPLMEAAGHKIQTVRILNELSGSYRRMGDYYTAVKTLTKSLSVLETFENKPLKTETLFHLSGVYLSQGNYAKELETLQTALKVAEEIGIVRELGGAWRIIQLRDRIGIAYLNQGNTGQAFASFQNALEISVNDGRNHHMTALVLIHLGNTLRMQGYDKYALEFYQRAMTVIETMRNIGINPAAIYNSLGAIREAQGDLASALELYQKSLKSLESVSLEPNYRSMATGSVPDQDLSVFTLIYIGEIYSKQSRYSEALSYYQKAVASAEKIGFKEGLADALVKMANLYYLQGNHALALETTSRALELARFPNFSLSPQLDFARPTNPTYQLWKLYTLQGKIYRALGDREMAQNSFTEAIAVSESARLSVNTASERASFFAKMREPFEQSVELLMELHAGQPSEGFDAAAFELNERGRARALLESLSEARAGIRQGIDPALLEKEKQIRQQINARAGNQIFVENKFDNESDIDEEPLPVPSQPTEKARQERAALLKKEIDSLTLEYQSVQAQIRQQSPRYAALTQPQPLKLKDVQQEILDADTVLLQYALGEKKSFLWAIAKDSIKSYELPPRAEIEAIVRRAYALLSDGKSTVDEKAQAEYDREAARLSKMLLAPVAGQLQNKRILLVADGALQYLPFGALPVENTGAGQPLNVANEIISLPSVSTLAVIRREMSSRAPAAKSVAVFADPVFSIEDERLLAVKNKLPKNSEKSPLKLDNSRMFLEKAFNLRSDENKPLRISRLPFSRREADAILAVAPAGSSLKALDFKASLETALSRDLSNYRIVHFASHGLLNSENPELSGIVLSLVNEQGQPIDGFLRLNEIYNLHLPADLVVLSACQTALGKEIRGEGLIGLTRGFMYAGSPRVVASLWKVDDVATAELMKLFYQKMLKEEMRPAAALRAAKIEMWKQKRWNAPFYWAAFEIQGEWR